MDIKEKRVPKNNNVQMIPKPIRDNPARVEVDTTWGEIQPMIVAEGVKTVDELTVSRFQDEGGQIIDARTEDFFAENTIPGSINLPNDRIAELKVHLDETRPAIFFCNGPQCPQSPTAIRTLIKNGYPASKIFYYRGGMHCWITLGLPVVKGKKPTKNSNVFFF
jgi:rhodanese-related sulfurtransferase